MFTASGSQPARTLTRTSHPSQANYAGNAGSAVLVDLHGYFLVRNSRFVGNDVAFFGAIYAANGDWTVVQHCWFTGNSASGMGGGMYLLSGNVTVESSIFEVSVVMRVHVCR